MLRRSALAALAGPLLAQTGANARRKMNVLMIAIDDLRPELGCYGAKHVFSPNIDALARRGTLFTRAYCQQAVCSPSRTSILTGLRPDTTKIYELQTHFRKHIPSAVTLPEAFKNAGYATTGFSKIFHGGLNDTQSWSIPHWQPGRKDGPTWNSAEAREAAIAFTERLKADEWRIGGTGSPTGSRGPSWESPDVADNALADGQTADIAVQALRKLKGQPFFAAVGFLKPHLPFIAPKKYFDLYPLDKIEMPDYPEAPSGAPPFAFHNSGELRYYGDIGAKPIPPEKARELVRAYYAATSYTDAQVGKVLAELDRQGLRENTIVALWGDHGWHLNNHGLWNKHSNFEKATNSTLIVSSPTQRERNNRCERLVEFVDIYPTLTGLADIASPANLEGRSFAKLLDNPKLPWKSAAFSQFPRNHEGKALMGYTIRTDRHRYTEWQIRSTGEAIARELYDYEIDPQETANHASNPENGELIASLSAQLKAGWRAATPRGN